MKKISRPAGSDENDGLPQFELNKRLTAARTDETRAREHAQITREKKLRSLKANRDQNAPYSREKPSERAFSAVRGSISSFEGLDATSLESALQDQAMRSV